MEVDISYSFSHVYRYENDLIHKVKTFYLTFFFMKYSMKVVLTVRKCGFYHFIVVVVVVVVMVVYPCVPLGTKGICEVSSSDCSACQPLNLTACFATFSWFLQFFLSPSFSSIFLRIWLPADSSPMLGVFQWICPPTSEYDQSIAIFLYSFCIIIGSVCNYM